MPAISKPVRQVAALLLLLSALASITLMTIVPLAKRFSNLDDQIMEERAMLGRFQAIAQRQDEVLNVQRAARAASESGAFLKGEGEPIKAANLQALLADTAGRQGIRLSSTRALPQRDHAGLRLIGVRMQFNADIEQLRALLFDIESARPFLFVEGLQVRPVSALAQRDPELGGLLDVRFDVYGAAARKRG
jgi:general secretion pathway protein M